MPAAGAPAVPTQQQQMPQQQPAMDPSLEIPQDNSMDMTGTEEIPEGTDDSTMNLFAQLDPEQKETARKYIISMISQNNQAEQSMDMSQQQAPQQPQQVAEAPINEKLRSMDRKEKEQTPDEVMDKHKNNKSPWSCKQFGKK